MRRGLIEREVDQQDARRAFVSTTPEGRRLADGTIETMLVLLDRYADAFRGGRLQALIDELCPVYRYGRRAGGRASGRLMAGSAQIAAQRFGYIMHM